MPQFILVAGLLVINVIVFSIPVPNGLSISFLDVGQGDAILVEGPTGIRMLIDGGATRAVLRETGRRLPFFIRSLDAVVATHPDQDHIGGLVDALKRYDVAVFMEPGVIHDTPVSRALASAVSEEKRVERILARRGMRLLLGDGAYADILFPDRDVSRAESNTASVVMRVVYGEHEFILTGDSPQSIERYLVDGGITLASDVLKAGHHGSKTSSSEEFVKAVDPTYVVYSRGCDNRYGHPAPETVALFQKLSILARDTCEDGTVTFRSDGRNLELK